jgi:hypothetical protein
MKHIHISVMALLSSSVQINSDMFAASHIMMHCILAFYFIYCRYIDTAWYPTRSWLERVVILGVPQGVANAQVESKSKNLIYQFHGLY